MFTVYDVDQQTTKDHEYIEFVDAPTQYWTSNQTDVDNPSQIDRIESTYMFRSTGKGDAKDNPNTLEDASRRPRIRAKTITVQYNHMDRVQVRMGHWNNNSRADKGRKFLFGGRVPTFGCPPDSTTIT